MTQDLQAYIALATVLTLLVTGIVAVFRISARQDREFEEQNAKHRAKILTDIRRNPTGYRYFLTPAGTIWAEPKRVSSGRHAG